MSELPVALVMLHSFSMFMHNIALSHIANMASKTLHFALKVLKHTLLKVGLVHGEGVERSVIVALD